MHYTLFFRHDEDDMGGAYYLVKRLRKPCGHASISYNTEMGSYDLETEMPIPEEYMKELSDSGFRIH